MHESTDTLTRLTLAFPPALESRVVELLLEQEPPLPGFTILQGEGHGTDFARATIREQVRGRIDRRILMLVLPQARAMTLIDALRDAVPNPQTVWWLEPVLAFGRLT